MRSNPATPGFFDSKEYFRLAYYSVLQEPAANSLREEAERVRPQDKESFYLDVLGVGIVEYTYDTIWWVIYKSQILALRKLNSEQGLMPKSKIKEFYDAAAREYETEYSGFSFKAWLEYLESNALLKVHPSEMVEITVKGKDFLKYLLHKGRSEELRRL